MLPNFVNPSNLFLGVLITWLAFLSFFLIKTVRHYRLLISRVKKGDLKSILEEILNRVDKQGAKIDSLVEKTGDLEKKSLRHFQKIGFVRFNPFSDTGGDQSFCLSMLDEEDSGVVISSLHSRGQTRVYAKAIKKGKAKDFELSKEETETIKQAQKGRL